MSTEPHLPTLEGYIRGERKMSLSRLTDNKLFVSLLVPFVFWLLATAYGWAAIPTTVSNHEQRITHVEGDTRALRESAVRAEENFKFIRESLERLERRRGER